MYINFFLSYQFYIFENYKCSLFCTYLKGKIYPMLISRDLKPFIRNVNACIIYLLCKRNPNKCMFYIRIKSK